MLLLIVNKKQDRAANEIGMKPSGHVHAEQGRNVHEASAIC